MRSGVFPRLLSLRVGNSLGAHSLRSPPFSGQALRSARKFACAIQSDSPALGGRVELKQPEYVNDGNPLGALTVEARDLRPVILTTAASVLRDNLRLTRFVETPWLGRKGVSAMPKSVGRIRQSSDNASSSWCGRADGEELARQFETSAQCIRSWVRPGRPRRWAAPGPADHCRAGRAAAPPRESHAPGRAGDLAKRRGLGRERRPPEPVQGFEFVTAHRTARRIATICRVLASPQRLRRVAKAAARAGGRAEVELTAEIQAIHRESRGPYGVPRVHAEFTPHGVRVGCTRVGRLVRRAGLHGVSRRKQFVTTSATGPLSRDSRPWTESPLGDRHHVHRHRRRLPVSGGCPRRVESPGRRLSPDGASTHGAGSGGPGYGLAQPPSVAGHPSFGPGRPVHFDLVRPALSQTGVQPSMGSVGDAYDTALSGSLFATLECELLDRQRFGTYPASRLSVFESVGGLDDPRRRHSALGHLSPVAYERRELVGRTRKFFTLYGTQATPCESSRQW